ncbi:MAG TPA: hypothetical protein VH370_12185 [Humisphaera sp.]|jgi:hypothetical protein|nr:hypothetical protein [Humisphaera sp.]
MTDFRTLTVVVDVKRGAESSLRTLVDGFGDTIQNDDAVIRFGRSETIHFARWVLIDPPANEPSVPSRLVFSCNHDGPQDAQLKQIIGLASAALDAIYAMCEEYPAPGARNDESRLQYLRTHAAPVNSIFIGAPDRTLLQIRDEARLREGIESFLDSHDFTGRPARDVVKAIRDFVFNESALSWAREPAPPRAVTLPQLILFCIIALPLVPVVLIWLLILRICYERVEKPSNLLPSRLDPALLKILERREDIYVQNQFSQLMDIKAGQFRLLTLRAVLWTANFMGHNLFKNGTINSIPSIHFYSWRIMDGGKRLLFLSNFDGSWQNYLGDFIDKAAFGLNGVLSNCAGFPVTWFLFLKGVTDVEHYKAWARNANIPTQAWYTAYPTLDVKNINMNSTIRLGLLKDMDEQAAADWLRLF